VKVNWRFGRTYRLHLQDPKAKQETAWSWHQADLAGLLLGLLLNPENGYDTFFRNIGWLSLYCTASYTRKYKSYTTEMIWKFTYRKYYRVQNEESTYRKHQWFLKYCSFMHHIPTISPCMTYLIEQSPSWETNSSLAGQEISRLRWYDKVYYYIQGNFPLSKAGSIKNIFYILFPKNHFNIILLSSPRSRKWFFLSDFLFKYVWISHLFNVCYKPQLFHLIALIILISDVEYNYKVPHYALSQPFKYFLLICQNILLSTLLKHPQSMLSVRAGDQGWHP
jgi:hypothetical protein